MNFCQGTINSYPGHENANFVRLSLRILPEVKLAGQRIVQERDWLPAVRKVRKETEKKLGRDNGRVGGRCSGSPDCVIQWLAACVPQFGAYKSIKELKA